MKKYHLEILTFIMFAMITICAVFDRQLSLIQRSMLGYMFLFTLHEWEESRYPGGFSKLMAKFIELDLSQEKEDAAYIPVVVLLILITFIPFFTQTAVLALIPVYLGLFEAFIHVIGIKLHRMQKPYTPGMLTALCLCAASICVLAVFSKNHIVQGSEYVWGILLMFACFFAMQRTVISIFGLGYKDLFARVKSKFK